MILEHLSDQELLHATKDLVRKERSLKTSVLYHLREIESRRLFCEQGYSSLFAYAVNELKYSESSALRRIQASRLLFEVPDIGEKLDRGVLSLANISQASRFFRENLISGKKEKQEVLKKLENKSRSDGDKVLFKLSGVNEPPESETMRRNSSTSHELRFSLNDNAFKKLDELRGLLAHKGKRSLKDVFEYSIDLTIEQLKKNKFKLSPKKEKYSMEKSSTRYIPAGVRRAVFEKSGGRCENCGSNYKLEYDHIKPFSFGGETSEKNLRLLCFSCNQRQRIKAGLRAEASQTL